MIKPFSCPLGRRNICPVPSDLRPFSQTCVSRVLSWPLATNSILEEHDFESGGFGMPHEDILNMAKQICPQNGTRCCQQAMPNARWKVLVSCSCLCLHGACNSSHVLSIVLKGHKGMVNITVSGLKAPPPRILSKRPPKLSPWNSDGIAGACAKR